MTPLFTHFSVISSTSPSPPHHLHLTISTSLSPPRYLHLNIFTSPSTASSNLTASPWTSLLHPSSLALPSSLLHPVWEHPSWIGHQPVQGGEELGMARRSSHVQRWTSSEDVDIFYQNFSSKVFLTFLSSCSTLNFFRSCRNFLSNLFIKSFPILSEFMFNTELLQKT